MSKIIADVIYVFGSLRMTATPSPSSARKPLSASTSFPSLLPPSISEGRPLKSIRVHQFLKSSIQSRIAIICPEHGFRFCSQLKMLMYSRGELLLFSCKEDLFWFAYSNNLSGCRTSPKCPSTSLIVEEMMIHRQNSSNSSHPRRIAFETVIKF